MLASQKIFGCARRAGLWLVRHARKEERWPFAGLNGERQTKVIVKAIDYHMKNNLLSVWGCSRRAILPRQSDAPKRTVQKEAPA
jgi:hypothetical protein